MSTIGARSAKSEVAGQTRRENGARQASGVPAEAVFEIARPRLDEPLEQLESGERTAIALWAAAGAGKSALIARWARSLRDRGEMVRWALGPALPDVVAELRGSRRTVYLFIDDAHRITSVRAKTALTSVLEDATSDIRVVVAGRYQPVSGLAFLLASGRLLAQVGYLKWTHRLRGELPPGEFLGVAETTGLASTLSRALLAGLAQDFAAMGAALPPDVRFSFGALRHHLLQDDFVDDIGRFLAQSGMPASRLELRIAERTFASMNASISDVVEEQFKPDLIVQSPTFTPFPTSIGDEMEKVEGVATVSRSQIAQAVVGKVDLKNPKKNEVEFLFGVDDHLPQIYDLDVVGHVIQPCGVAGFFHLIGAALETNHLVPAERRGDGAGDAVTSAYHHNPVVRSDVFAQRLDQGLFIAGDVIKGRPAEPAMTDHHAAISDLSAAGR